MVIPHLCCCRYQTAVCVSVQLRDDSGYHCAFETVITARVKRALGLMRVLLKDYRRSFNMRSLMLLWLIFRCFTTFKDCIQMVPSDRI